MHSFIQFIILHFLLYQKFIKIIKTNLLKKIY